MSNVTISGYSFAKGVGVGTTTAPDVGNVDSMKQYLKDLYMVHTEQYCVQEAKKIVRQKINGLNAPGRPVEPTTMRKEMSNAGTLLWRLGGLAMGAGIGFFVVLIGAAMLLDVIPGFEENNGIQMLVVAAGTIIGGIIGFAKSTSFFREDAKQKVAAYEEYRKKVEQANILKPQYEAEFSQLDEVERECEKALNQLYRYNIIFAKYRTLGAISQIYEYYMAGRCNCLEGPDGAYNLFESELRQNIIIVKLDQILSCLQQIMGNQLMLYTAVQQSNTFMGTLRGNQSGVAIANYKSNTIATLDGIVVKYL